MKVNKKIVFAVAYIVGALIAYLFFIEYSVKKHQEEVEIRTAEWVARTGLPAYLYDDFFFTSVYGRNVVAVGTTLIYGGLIGAFVLLTVFGVLNERKNT